MQIYSGVEVTQETMPIFEDDVSERVGSFHTVSKPQKKVSFVNYFDSRQSELFPFLYFIGEMI